MEIHPPKHPIHSIKEFLRELVTIIAGILIALSLDGLVEWHHHRELAREARANIISELRGNQRELTNEMQDLPKMQQQTQVLVDVVHKLQINRNIPVHDFGYNWTIAELHSTSWDTAARTGAISYMPYAEVKQYTQMYDLQHDFMQLQERGFNSALEVEGLVTLLDRKVNTFSAAELSDAERRLGIAMANVRAMQQIAESLDQRYVDLLKSAQE